MGRLPSFRSIHASLNAVLEEKGNVPFLLILLSGLGIFLWKLAIVWPIHLVGLVDPAAYAEMASSLLSGRGLEVDYISMHFLKFGPEISHPEETWPPFYSFLIVPFFAVMGKSALAAKLPSLLISCFGLPAVTFGLAVRVTRSKWVALVSGLSILISWPVFHWSLYATADIAFGFLVALAVLLALKGFEKPRWFSGMGAALAAAYYAKGSALVLLPAFGLYYVLRRRQDRRDPLRRRRDVLFLAGFALTFLLLLPWFVRNTVYFNDPLYCTHKHVAGYVGWEPWEERTYALYWDEEPPSIWDKLEEPGRLARTSLIYFMRQLRLLFLKMDERIFMFPDTPLEPFAVSDISTYWIGLPALLGILLYAAASSIRLLALIGFSAPENKGGLKAVIEAPLPFALPGYGLFLLTGSSLVAFLSIFWVPTSRYTTPVIPLMFVLGWATVHSIAGRVLSRLRAPGWSAGAAVLVLFSVWALNERGELVEARTHRGYPWKETGQAWMEMGEWIRENLPGAVVMTRNPWGLHFYSQAKAVQIPYAPLDKVLEAARHYRVTHLIPDPTRPALQPWVRGAIPGLRRIRQVRHLELFAVDYGLVPPGPAEKPSGG